MNIQGFIPAIAAPVLGSAASAVKAATSSTSSTSSTPGTGNSAASLQDTFLNLLVTELQNQDPTSPVDPTADGESDGFTESVGSADLDQSDAFEHDHGPIRHNGDLGNVRNIGHLGHFFNLRCKSGHSNGGGESNQYVADEPFRGSRSGQSITCSSGLRSQAMPAS